MVDTRWQWLPGTQPADPPEDVEALPPLAPHPDVLFAAMQQASESNMATLLCVGWAPTALPLLLRDQWLRRKRIIWAIEPGHAADAQETLEALWDGEAPVLLAVYADRDGLTRIQRTMPDLHYAVACFSDDIKLVQHVQSQRVHRFCVSSFTVERICEDLTHILARADRLDQGIPISAWRGRCAGGAAICIAAGPSLDRAMPFVRRHMDSCVVIVCDVVWKRLQDEGIRVDFVVTVDTLNENFSDRIVATRDPRTVLVMPASSHRDLDARFPNRTYFFSSGIDHCLVDGEGFSTGTNVGRSTVGLAYHLGCKDIVLVGHDLAFDSPGYYSSMVFDREPLADSERKLHGKQNYLVPGNAGVDVPSMVAFRIGIDDLAALAHHDPAVRWMNYNINLGCGAKVAGYAEVPEAWTPPATAKPPAIPTERLPAAVAERAQALPARLDAELLRLEDIWRQALENGRPAVEIIQEVATDQTLVAGRDFAEPYFNGFYAFLFMLAGMPNAVSTAAHAREATQRLIEALGRCRATVARIAASHAYQQPPLEGPGNIWRELLTSVADRVPAVPADSHIPVVVPVMAREYVSLLRNEPGSLLPAPLSLVDAVMCGLSMGSWVPQSWMEQTFCLLAMATSADDEGVRKAAAAGLIDIAPVWPVPDGPQHQRATRAVLALAAGRVPDAEAAAACALAASWHPCASALISALATRKDFPELLAGLLAARALVPDDQIAAQVVARHPDPIAAADLLEPFGPFGDATSLAIAVRLQGIKAHAQAIAEAQRIHLLSPLAEDALALICASADALGLPAEVDRTISSIPNHSLACCVLYRYVRTRFGPLAALRNLVDIGAFPIPQQLVNEVLQWAIQRQGRGEADGAAEVLDRAIAGSLATDMRPAERDLMRGCEIIVAELRETLARRR